MQTTEIKYAIMDRVTGKLLTYYQSISVNYFITDEDGVFETWYTDTLTQAHLVFSASPNKRGSYANPVHGIDISPDSHCVVKVTMVCNVEIVEQIRIDSDEDFNVYFNQHLAKYLDQEI